MSDTGDALGSDPGDWPDELYAQWERCGLPSLHDFLLAQERLAMEVRRQNRELQRLASAVEVRPVPVAAAVGDDAGVSPGALLALADAVDRLAAGLVRARAGVAAALPRPRRFLAGSDAWRGRVDEILGAQEEGGRLVAERMRDALDAAGITAIVPVSGDAFDPGSQRVVALAPGVASHVVAVERPGYRCGETVLRPAEVTVGCEGGET